MNSRDDARLTRRVGIAMYLVGGISAFLVLTAPDPDTSDHHALALLGGVLLLSAAALALVRNPSPWLLSASPLWGIVVVSAIVAIARPTGGTPFFYLWPILYTSYFRPRRDVVAALGILAATFGIAMAVWVPPGIRMMVYLDAVVSITLVAVLVTLLKERLDRVLSQLHDTATTDSLTGLLNRRAFETAFSRELARAARSELPLSLVLFDLDFFKQVNDRLGHAGGDRALCRFAEILREERRDGDVLARVGGEEFALVLFAADAAAARRHTELVCAALATATAGTDAPLTVSAGVASLGPACDDEDALLLAADRALYRAKEAGRRRVVVSEPDDAGPVTPALRAT